MGTVPQLVGTMYGSRRKENGRAFEIRDTITKEGVLAAYGMRNTVTNDGRKSEM